MHPKRYFPNPLRGTRSGAQSALSVLPHIEWPVQPPKCHRTSTAKRENLERFVLKYEKSIAKIESICFLHIRGNVNTPFLYDYRTQPYIPLQSESQNEKSIILSYFIGSASLNHYSQCQQL